MKIIYRPADILEGHIVCHMLRANGIDAQLIGEYQQGGIGELMPADFASVKVHDEQLESANLLITEYAQQIVQEKNIHGPKNKPVTLFLTILVIWIAIYLYFTLFLNH